MVEQKPDALLILGDTNSCLSAIAAKRLHIPIFHMEAGNRCFDECLPEETNRRIVDHHFGREPVLFRARPPLSERRRRTAKERTYRHRFPDGRGAARQPCQDRGQRHACSVWGWRSGSTFCSPPTARRTSTQSRTSSSLFTAINHLAETYDMPILYSCHPRSRKRLEQCGFKLDKRVHAARASGLPRLQPPADERLLRGVRFSGTLPEESSFFTQRGASLPGGLHPHLHRAPRGAGQGLLCAGRHPRRRRGAGRCRPPWP